MVEILIPPLKENCYFCPFQEQFKRKKDSQSCKHSVPQWTHNLNYFKRARGKKWKKQYRNSEYYICSTFGVGVGRMVLIDSQVCFYHKWISILTPLTCTQFPIHREIWSQVSFSSFFWWTFYIAIVRWCLQEFLSLRFLLLVIISLPTWKCEQTYIFPISWLFWQFSLKGRKSPIKFLWAPKAETSAGVMSSLLALLLGPSLELIISLFHQCPCTQWGTQREVSGKTHYK